MSTGGLFDFQVSFNSWGIWSLRRLEPHSDDKFSILSCDWISIPYLLQPKKHFGLLLGARVLSGDTRAPSWRVWMQGFLCFPVLLGARGDRLTGRWNKFWLMNSLAVYQFIPLFRRYLQRYVYIYTYIYIYVSQLVSPDFWTIDIFHEMEKNTKQMIQVGCFRIELFFCVFQRIVGTWYLVVPGMLSRWFLTCLRVRGCFAVFWSVLLG